MTKQFVAEEHAQRQNTERQKTERKNTEPAAPRSTGAPLGILLLNLGTPDSPTTGAVRRYLRQFLSDPRVMDISPIGRFFLLNFIILPLRSPKSAEAYRLVWTENGSPIIEHGRNLTKLVQQSLDAKTPNGYKVKLAMRYGQPSIENIMQEFHDEGIDSIKVVTLFPQYASATIGSSIEEVYRVANQQLNIPTITATPAYYDHPGYIGAFAEVTTKAVANEDVAIKDYDHYLFSFHGLPERHILKAEQEDNPDQTKHCLIDGTCCQEITARNRNCYRAQCYATARGIAQELNLADGTWSVSFQSRLGREQWIEPYTDVRIEELAKSGVKSMAILSPAFVADCLETLEELGIRGKESFMEAGGEKFIMIPSLNTNPRWVETVVDIATTDPNDIANSASQQNNEPRQSQPSKSQEPQKEVKKTMNTKAANMLEPALSRKGLVILSGIVWALAGVMLFVRASLMVEALTATSVALIVVGLVVGTLKSKFVLSKVARKNIARIKTMSPDKEKICLFAFQPLMSYILIGVMIGSGATLRHFYPHSIYVASLYFAIGAALLYSGLEYFKSAKTV